MFMICCVLIFCDDLFHEFIRLFVAKCMYGEFLALLIESDASCVSLTSDSHLSPSFTCMGFLAISICKLVNAWFAVCPCDYHVISFKGCLYICVFKQFCYRPNVKLTYFIIIILI
jgi:hypothetical protein